MFAFLSSEDLHYRQALGTQGAGEGKVIRRGRSGDEYAHVKLCLEPLEDGSGFEFSERTMGAGAIAARFFSYIEIGALRTAQTGLWGFPLTDFRVRIIDGNYHEVDSTASAFEDAAKLATLYAMENSAPKLLEPWLNLTVRVPHEYLGGVFGDLSSRRATVLRQGEFTGGPAVVCSLPQSEAIDYFSTFASLTNGCGTLSLDSSKVFRPLPESLTQCCFCPNCNREMVIPLVRGKLFTETCLICQNPFGPTDFDTGVLVRNR